MSEQKRREAGATIQNGADRRVSQRFKADEVPWITLVKANLGETARLVDISRTGMLLETHARLHPGRKNIVLLGTESEQKRVETLVVRTQLIGLTPKVGPLYRAALTFTQDLELDLPLPTVNTPSPEPGIVSAASELVAASEGETESAGLRLNGPFEGLWATEAGAEMAAASLITETGCVVEAPTPVTVGQWASLSVFFSVARRALLTGKVTRLIQDRSWTFRFENLSAEERRSLRVEIRRGTPSPPRTTATLSHMSANGPFGVLSQATARVAILQTNHW